MQWYNINNSSSLAEIENDRYFTESAKEYLNLNKIDYHMLIELHERARLAAVKLGYAVDIRPILLMHKDELRK